jgi:hypothetical protein
MGRLLQETGRGTSNRVQPTHAKNFPTLAPVGFSLGTTAVKDALPGFKRFLKICTGAPTSTVNILAEIDLVVLV